MTTLPPPQALLEQALADVERDADATVRALMAAVKAAKRAKNAAAAGSLRDLQQAVDAADSLAGEARESAAALRRSWRFDAPAHFASGVYAKELLAAADEAGLQAFEVDDRILSYPSIVALSPADTTVIIDKRKDRRVRPSAVIGHLAARQQRPPKFRPEPFLETLAKAYDLVAPRAGATVKLVDVYAVLTLLPGASRDYTKPEFARDVYLLDQSGVTVTRGGRALSLPASALTRGTGVLQTVTRGGQVKVYAGIALAEGRA